jgi:hypothetical protein
MNILERINSSVLGRGRMISISLSRIARLEENANSPMDVVALEKEYILAGALQLQLLHAFSKCWI